MESKANTPCPEKLWQALEMAIADLKTVEKLPGYCVDMGSYVGEKDEKCSVCLAGSVMVRRLGANIMSSTYNFPSWRETLNLLSDIAFGEMLEGDYEEEVYKKMKEIKYTYYPEGKNEFYDYLGQILEVLKGYNV